MTTDADIRRDLRKTKDWHKADEQAIERAVLANLASEDGRNFLWWLLEIGRINMQPFDRDPSITAFNCGELNVGNQILARVVETSPEGYLAMQKERANARSSRDTQLSAASDEPIPDESAE